MRTLTTCSLSTSSPSVGVLRHSRNCSPTWRSARRPAILAARSLRAGSITDDTRRRLAAGIADAFWRLFNRPAVIALLRQLAAGTADVRDESAYWRLVLRYCRQGNLQAVLDEQWHLLWEQDSWSEDAGPDETAARCARKLSQVVHPARARVHAEFFRAERGASGATVECDKLRVRTVFVLRFGHVRTDDGDYVSQDAARAARAARRCSTSAFATTARRSSGEEQHDPDSQPTPPFILPPARSRRSPAGPKRSGGAAKRVDGLG